MRKAKRLIPMIWQRIQKICPRKKKKVYPLWLMISVIPHIFRCIGTLVQQWPYFECKTKDVSIDTALVDANITPNNQDPSKLEIISSPDVEGLSSIPPCREPIEYYYKFI